MQKLILLYLLIMASMPIFSQPYDPSYDPIEFIGLYDTNMRHSIATELWSGMPNILFNQLKHSFIPNPCDSLDDMNDSISGCIWNTIPWSYYQGVINILSGFPGCSVWTVYRVRICPNNPSKKQIELVSFSANYIAGSNIGCDSLANYLSTGTDEQKAIKLLDIEDEIYELISQYEAEKTAPFVSCDSLGNNLPHQVFYREKICKSKLLLNVQTAAAVFSYYLDFACNMGEAGCCKTTVSFCKNSFGETVRYVNKEQIGITCDGYPTDSDYGEILSNEYNYWLQFVNNPIISFTAFPCENSCNN
ncbi:MAG: hypothetical protein IJK61_02710 [Bacteroidetes bacterium]|nr:hypothetical protein [Bacteroidota bacterium]